MNLGAAVALARMNAAACELAAEKRCRCHCGGALHGKQHGPAAIVAAAQAATGAPEHQVQEELMAQLDRAATLRAQLRLELEAGELTSKAEMV